MDWEKEEIKEVLKLVKHEGIARRFFVMNSFDGILTVLGVLIAMFLFEQTNSRFVILSCLAPALALMVSGIWSAYTIEKAERKKELDVIEDKMLMNLEETKIGKQLDILVVIDSLINGLSPLIVSLILISPFTISLLGIITIKVAFYISFALAVLVLFFLGVYVSRIGENNMLVMGLSMVIVGIAIAVVMYILNKYVLPTSPV